MPENNTPAFQWANWMAAAHEAAQSQIASNPVILSKEAPAMEKMMGGWQAEGKEKPVTPIICTRCQWVRRNEQSEETEKSSWCESCLEGKPGPGTVPEGPKKPYVSRSDDVADYNRTFFGG